MTLPHMQIPRPDTGLYNAKLGVWLFLASETMLFGSLISCYVFLRAGSTSWPHGSDLLNVPLATINTLVLLGSSMTMRVARVSVVAGRFDRFRLFLALTILLGAAFLAIKGCEYGTKFAENLFPSRSTFLAIYFVLTGIHALHVLGGILVNASLLARGATLNRSAPGILANHIEVAGLYWHFVDGVWLVLFPLLYLL